LPKKKKISKKIYQNKIDDLNKTIGQKNEEISKITARLETRELVHKDALSENTAIRANISKLEALLKVNPSPNLILVDELTVFSKKVKKETEALQAFIAKFFNEAHASLYIQSDIDTLLQVTAATTLELRTFLVQIINKLNISSSMLTSEDIDLINEAEHMRKLLNPSTEAFTKPQSRRQSVTPQKKSTSCSRKNRHRANQGCLRMRFHRREQENLRHLRGSERRQIQKKQKKDDPKK